MILAGGLGTRLKPVIGTLPKCMAPVGGRPFLEYLVHAYRNQGAEEIILCTGYRSQPIFDHFGDGRQFGIRITYSHELAPLGTAGALKKAEPLVQRDSFMVSNGDSFLDIDTAALLDYHESRKSMATIALVHVPNTSRYGRVELGPDNQVVAFTEKARESGPGLINAGVYVFHREVLARIPSDRPVSLENETLPSLTKGPVFGYQTNSLFVDIGTPEDYRALLQNPVLLERLSRLASPPKSASETQAIAH
ncbi:MAG: nucleotidyltransferase family protein [candidate division WOR-3 bacterium]